MSLKTVDIMFYPLYKGEPSNKVIHKEVKKVYYEKKIFFCIKRKDDKVYKYPVANIMRTIVSKS